MTSVLAGQTRHALATPYVPSAAEQARYGFRDGVYATLTGKDESASFYSAVTSIGCDTLIGTTGFPMTQACLTSGAFVGKALSAPMELANPMTLSASSFTFSIQYEASRPVSARVYITEAALRLQ